VGLVLGADGKTPGEAGPVAMAKKVALPKAATVYLTMQADAPSGREVGYSALLAGRSQPLSCATRVPSRARLAGSAFFTRSKRVRSSFRARSLARR
jgi:hypothetical protein